MESQTKVASEGRLTIRPFTNDDYVIAVSFVHEFYKEKEKYGSVLHGHEFNREDAEFFFQNVIMQFHQSGAVLIAEVDDQPVGFHFWVPVVIGKVVDYSTVHGGTYVKPDHRNKGVASSLREQAASICLDAGYQKVLATVERDNHPARSLIAGPDWNHLAEVVCCDINSLK